MKYGKVRSIYASLELQTAIDIETDISQGLFSFEIVGLAGKRVEEARQRIYTALRHSGYPSPKTKNHKIVVSLSPAHIHKDSTHFDSAIALSYLIATQEICIAKEQVEKLCIIGELTLEGNVVACPHIFALLCAAEREGFSRIFYPYHNKHEIEHIAGVDVCPYTSLNHLVQLCTEMNLSAKTSLPSVSNQRIDTNTLQNDNQIHGHEAADPFQNIHGQFHAKRGVFISLCGKHHTLLWGAPGTGKTLLGDAASKLQPALSIEESKEVALLYAHKGEQCEWRIAPYRTPHHQISKASLFGGRTPLQPGEISLAHNGLLVLHEFTEMKSEVREGLREPMEYSHISLQSNGKAVSLPAAFTLIATCNPCPCGNYGSADRCNCSPGILHRYIQRVSGALWDRFCMCIHVQKETSYARCPHPYSADIKNGSKYTKSAVHAVRHFSKERNLKQFGTHMTNNAIPYDMLDAYVSQNFPKTYSFFAEYCSRKKLSMRVFHSGLRVARTIADTEHCDSVEVRHAEEALTYRLLPHFSP